MILFHQARLTHHDNEREVNFSYRGSATAPMRSQNVYQTGSLSVIMVLFSPANRKNPSNAPFGFEELKFNFHHINVSLNA
jgi:hypothetical protein